MIRATFVTAAAADPGARTITGTAVPWNVRGVVSDGTAVVFHPGSLDAGARPHLLRDHDPGRPLGMVVDAADTGQALTATARVSRVHDGDEALILAADGVLGMFSVGVDPTDYAYDADGTMHVHAGTWNELSLLTVGAYSDARVASVTASQPTNNEGAVMPDQLTLVGNDLADLQAQLDALLGPADDDTPDEDAPADDEDTTVMAGAPRRLPAPRPPTVPLRAAAGTGTRPRQLDMRGLAAIIAAGKQRGEGASGIRSRIQAALTNVTTSDVAGFVPAYRRQLAPIVDHGMPLVRAIANAPLPASGMTIESPVWTATPNAYAIQTAEKTQIGTGPVTAGIASVDIDTWAQGNDISFQALNRSDPSFVEAYLRAAAVDAGRKYDTHVATALLAGATAATAGTDFVSNVQALFAALNPATTPGGPMFLAMSYDQTVGMIGVTGQNGPAFWDVSMSLGDFDPAQTSGGLLAFTDWNLPAGTMLLGSRAGATSYGGPDSSADVRVVDVSLLGIDIGVYFYAALIVDYPGAFAKLSGLTALGAAAPKTSK